jgi:chemotaxis signal transduction protein/nucleoid-associated protein YgaU
MHAGGARYAVRGSDVTSVEPHPHLYRLPVWPPTVAGISRSEGQNVLVLDLAACLGADITGPGQERWLLRLEGGERPRAFEVRCHVEHLEVEEIDALPLPSTLAASGIRECVHCGNELIPLIDASNLWNQAEHTGAVPSPSGLSGSPTSDVGQRFLRESIDIVEVTFRGKRYALPADEATGSFAVRPYVAVPNVAAPVVGVAEHHAALLPVVDIAGALGLRSHITPESQMVVVENGELRVLLLVDTVAPSRTLPASQQRQIPPSLALPHAPAYGCYVDDAGVGAVLNVAAIVTNFAEIEARSPIPTELGPPRAAVRPAKPLPSTARPERVSVEASVASSLPARPAAIVGSAADADTADAAQPSDAEQDSPETSIAPRPGEAELAGRPRVVPTGAAASPDAVGLPAVDGPPAERSTAPQTFPVEQERGEASTEGASGQAERSTAPQTFPPEQHRGEASTEGALEQAEPAAASQTLPVEQALREVSIEAARGQAESAAASQTLPVEQARREVSIEAARGQAEPAAVASASHPAPASERTPALRASQSEPCSDERPVAPVSGEAAPPDKARPAEEPSHGSESTLAPAARARPAPKKSRPREARPDTTRPLPGARQSAPTLRGSRVRVASFAALLLALALVAIAQITGGLPSLLDLAQGPADGPLPGTTESDSQSRGAFTRVDSHSAPQSDRVRKDPAPSELGASERQPHATAPAPAAPPKPERSESGLSSTSPVPSAPTPPQPEPSESGLASTSAVPSEPTPPQPVPSKQAPRAPSPAQSAPSPPDLAPPGPALGRQSQSPFREPPSVPGAADRPRSPRAVPPARSWRDAIVHVVVRGDTLWDLCERYTGDPFDYPRVARDNAIPNPHLIEPGQVIRFRKH